MDDLLESCISDFDVKKDYQAFKETFCVRCHRPECVHAGKANDGFTQRVKTQVDRLFNAPVTDNRQPQYAMITDFVDVSSVAEKIEINSRPPPVAEPVKTKDDWKADYLDKHLGIQDEPLQEPPSKDEGPKQHAPSMIIKPGNTAVPARGITLSGGANPVPQKVIDPWAIPAASKTVVVERGAKIKMGE